MTVDNNTITITPSIESRATEKAPIVESPYKEEEEQNVEVEEGVDFSGLEELQVQQSFSLPEAEGFSLDYYQKARTGDNIRRNYLSKLAYQKIWLTPNAKPKLHETCIIFDWDDTLLCTSFINPSGVYENVELSPVI